jgi:hypothetical protein
MKPALPVIRGIIARRILVNFRVKPGALAPLLPAPFRPKLVRGWGMAGICLIRLEALRPRFLSAVPGLTSENAAHRIAVEWNEGDTRREGVFLPRRDTNSRLNRLAGGRVFPGAHHPAKFECAESANRFKVELRSEDGETIVRVAARIADAWPDGSVFGSLGEASDFFAAGSCGWSPRAGEDHLEGMELRTGGWRVEPLIVERLETSYFQAPTRFPTGSVEYDCALLMRGIPHEWHALGTMETKEIGTCAR